MQARFMHSEVGALTNDSMVIRKAGIRDIHVVVHPLLNLTTSGVVSELGVDRTHTLLHEVEWTADTVIPLLVWVR